MRKTTYRGTSGLRVAVAMFAVMAWSESAAAHIHLTSPPARYPMDAQKDPPCGADPGAPPAVVGGVTVFQAGETITLTVDEFVGHSGSLRVAIDPTGTDTFEFPTSYDDLSGPNILASFDDPGGMGEHQLEVELPDEPCDPCTLQVIQFMEDGSFSNDDFYFQCADIVIEGVGGATDGTDSGPSDDTAGSASASATGSDSDGGGDDGSATGGTAGNADTDDGPGDGADDGADDAADDGASGGIATGATEADGGSSNDDSGGCSCSSTPAPASAAWLLGLLGLARVRRRR